MLYLFDEFLALIMYYVTLLTKMRIFASEISGRFFPEIILVKIWRRIFEFAMFSVTLDGVTSLPLYAS